MLFENIKKQDKLLYDLLLGEIKRQQDGVELIASENYVSNAVLEAMRTVFTNKYSEGYPGKRYYGGQDFTDQIERIAIERACNLFNCDHANVQPLSGAIANISVLTAYLEPGDTVLGFELSHGGHLTHGSPVTFMSKVYNFVRYTVKDFETGQFDFDQIRDLAIKHRPKMILVGYSAYPRDIDYAKFAEIGKEIGAMLWADIAHIAGLISAGIMRNPFDFGFHVVSSTTHKTLRGPRGGLILSKGKVSNPLKKVKKSIKNLPTLVDRAVFPGIQGGPIMNLIYAKAVAFGEALQESFKEYAKQIVNNAKVFEKVFRDNGIIMYTGGTDNHMIIFDSVKSFGYSGKTIQEALDEAGITVSKSTIPFDTRSPVNPSGIRIGTPAITTRGYKEKEVEFLAECIIKICKNPKDDKLKNRIKHEIAELNKRFPIPY
ncbi:MAG: serine hydroxymethyltransferase [Candidatus Dojkabacteria bacterium]|nr:serine hydroxymethyltransferase [Candidatus Dojkabacteria bacterium]